MKNADTSSKVDHRDEADVAGEEIPSGIHDVGWTHLTLVSKPDEDGWKRACGHRQVVGPDIGVRGVQLSTPVPPGRIVEVVHRDLLAESPGFAGLHARQDEWIGGCAHHD